MKKKEKVMSESAPIEERSRDYLEHKKQLKELSYNKKSDMEILSFCLRSVPSKVKELDAETESNRELLKKWIEADYSNYLICEKYNVYHIDLLTLYLTKKLKATVTGLDNMSLLTSYDKKMLVNYRYETKKGETISYFDKALGVPTSLVATAELKLKLENALKLVETVDVEVKYIDAVIVNNFITSTLNRVVRDTILNFIDSNDVSFYDLPHHYTAINLGVLEALRAAFEPCGLNVTDFVLSDISVPNNTDQMLKNQFFAIAEAERVKAYEQRMEKTSLDLYERKAEIHSKYPDFPLTLTETEKDLALNRYLTRTGHNTTLKADIKEEKISKRDKKFGGTATAEHAAVPTVLVDKSNRFRVVFILMAIVFTIIALSMFAVAVKAGLIALGVDVLVCGLIASFGYNKLKYGSAKAKVIGEDDESESSDASQAQQPQQPSESGDETDNT